jgi:hypothetical protein
MNVVFFAYNSDEREYIFIHIIKKVKLNEKIDLALIEVMCGD